MKLTSKHFLQNVCWQGSTFDDVSSRSRHTEHSRISFDIETKEVAVSPLSIIFNI